MAIIFVMVFADIFSKALEIVTAKTHAKKSLTILAVFILLSSNKNTDITNMMVDRINPVYVHGQANRSSLSVTEKYTHKDTSESFEQIRKLIRQDK
ncbi:MAG: hypothetical protein PHE33_00860 [Bacteroidales bacterium]|nr:hypothetical protein [Bacteroidales bacterium]